MHEGDEPAVRGPKPHRRWVGTGALVGAGVLAGAMVASGIAGAASSTSSPSASSGSRTWMPGGAGMDPANLTHGPGETLVSGSDLATITEAAKAAVPGATILRVESDSNGGATYEAHVRKADGSFATVQFDKNLKATGTVDGFGPGGPGSGPLH